MTKIEFAQFIDRLNLLWGIEFEKDKSAAWYEVLGGLNFDRLLKSLSALSLECKFYPKISEIVAKYEDVMREQAQIAREAEISKYLLTTAEFHYCYICKNEGGVFYKVNNYEYYCRCSCGRGRDLNKWSRHQITMGMMWLNPNTKKEESLYVPNVDDVLTQEEIEVLRVKNMSKSPDIANKTDIKGMIQGFFTA